MKFLLCATLAAALSLVAGCGTPSNGAGPVDGPGVRAGSGIEVFGTIDASVSGVRNK